MIEEETIVWNRACNIRGFSPTLPGDVALRWAISFDGVACNGGVTHSLEFHSRDITKVFDAFETLGAPEMRGLLVSLTSEYAAASQAERSRREQEFNRRYHEAMNGDRLTTLFEFLYKSSPELFARP